MKKILLFLTAFLCCFFMNVQLASATEVAEEGIPLTVYVKNNAAWDVINIYAWDEHNGAATNMEWVETPMEDLGNGWSSYTLTTYKEFYLCFQDGGSVWTNDVPVEAGVSEVYLDLTASVKGEKQVCQYTEEKPGEDSAIVEFSGEKDGVNGMVIAIVVVVIIAILAVGACLVLKKKKSNK